MQCLLQFNNPKHPPLSENETNPHAIIKSGTFLRHSDHVKVQRFYCKTCKRSFSTETQSPYKYQKKRHLNDTVFTLFASCLSQRRMAKVLSVNRKTVVRKFELLGRLCLRDIEAKKHLPKRSIGDIVFDEMETFEHSKMKPLSIALAVEDKTRLILDFKVSSMKAKGLLAKKAKEKYGFRKDERKKNLNLMLGKLKELSPRPSLIKSDMCPHYPAPVQKIFPESYHQVFKGRRGCVVGQGELKAGGFDPLFSLNHTAAMLRANVNRLFRRTWNTTKKLECLKYHIAIYVFYHNLRLLKDPGPPP
jgi:hypothetical protein